MKLAIIVASVLALSGCASKCTSHCVFGFGPGSDAFTAVAKHYDDSDPCILKGKPVGTVRPDFCGASSGKTVSITKSIHPNTYLVNVR
jgi:hypothetical protein